jgi:hypothetical protein
MNNKENSQKYTCNEYREEMILAGLRKRLNQADLSNEERLEIEEEVLRREKEMGF